MKTPILLFYNCVLFIGLIVCFLNSSVLSVRCLCPTRNQIELSEEYNKAVIVSPNFPRPYCSKLNCEWRIYAPSNNSIVRFTSPKIDLRRNRDYIYFFDDSIDEPSYNCTGRIKNCEFVSTGPLLIVRFTSSRGVVDKYGFQGTITLLDSDEDIQSISDEDEDEERPLKHRSSSTWNFFILVGLACLAVFLIAALLYWLCKKQKAAEDNRSPLLKSSKREDSVHLSLNSPDELNE